MRHVALPDRDECFPESPPQEENKRTTRLRVHIERALHQLPTLQRALVILRHMNGMSTREVGAILGCSHGTVKTHLHRGLKKMRSCLGFLKVEGF
ncbi:MAG: sigma-70 family RNA polymerase sigma factor [Ignavibacteria bacterium]|nr:MAG: sigma-70 family RNA polymerase sigma factor [Ignavibacteria bacterium]